MKELGQAISEKARKRIVIVAKLNLPFTIIELKSYYHFIFLFLYFVAVRFCQFTDEHAITLSSHTIGAFESSSTRESTYFFSIRFHYSPQNPDTFRFD